MNAQDEAGGPIARPGLLDDLPRELGGHGLSVELEQRVRWARAPEMRRGGTAADAPRSRRRPAVPARRRKRAAQFSLLGKQFILVLFQYLV